MTFGQLYFIIGGPLIAVLIGFALVYFTKPKRHQDPAE
jgi:hypothetical protein